MASTVVDYFLGFQGRINSASQNLNAYKERHMLRHERKKSHVLLFNHLSD
jgi:hypothetical protein